MVSKTILVADDNPSIRYLIRHLMETSGFLCCEAPDGAQAIKLAEQIHPDLILLDLCMPGLDGAIVASVLKRKMPKVPIILFTLYDDRLGEGLKKAIQVDAVLSKAEGLSGLLPQMEKLLGPESRRTNSVLL